MKIKHPPKWDLRVSQPNQIEADEQPNPKGDLVADAIDDPFAQLRRMLWEKEASNPLNNRKPTD